MSRLELLFIRHGKTAGNLRRSYIGATDEPLCPEGAAELARRQYPPAEPVFCSPLLRCRQTAALIYPQSRPYIIDNLREFDFGQFENLNYQDLRYNEAYRQWLATDCLGKAPGGEARGDFIARCCLGLAEALLALESLAEPPERAAFIVHGGTIMALLSRYTGGEYYSFMCQNGSGYRCFLEGERWGEEPRLLGVSPLFEDS